MGERLFSLFGLIIVALVARYLGPGDFGLLSYTFSLAALFATIGHLGLDGLIVREIVNQPDKVSRVLGTVFYMKVGAYLLSSLALLLYALLLNSHSQTEIYLFFCAAAFIALSPLNTFFSWFHAMVQARYVSISSITAMLVTGLLKLFLVFLGAGVVAFAAANVIQIIVAVSIGLFFYLRSEGPSPKKWKFSGETAKTMLSESWMIFLGTIFATIYLKIDQIMLRWMIGPEEVGIYAVAAGLSEAVYFIPTAIVASVFPKLVELRKSNEKIFHARLQQLFDLLSLAALAVLLGILLMGQPLIMTIFGAAYQASATILMVHILAAPFIFLRFAFSRWIIIEKFAIFSLITQGLGALVNIGFNLVLIPHFAGLGAAIATVVSYAVASYFALIVSQKTQPIFKMMSRSIFMPWRGVQCLLAIVRT
jgi:O-antigen/teichoic acid export membrane protein